MDAETIRMPSYAILGIDSEDRFKDYTEARAVTSTSFNRSPYDFQITKNESLMNGFFTRLAITEINFPWVIPNINDLTSQIRFEYQIVGNPAITVTIRLSYGFYRPSEIASEIQRIVRNLVLDLSGFNMRYGTDDTEFFPNQRPAFSYDNVSFPIAFLPMDSDSPAYPYPASARQLFDLLGFSNRNTTLSIVRDGLTTYCQSVRYIDIVCNQLTYTQALKDTMSQSVARDTMCRVYLGDANTPSTISPSDPLFCPPGCAPFTIYRQFSTPKFIRWLPDQPVQGNLRFQVFDDNGVALADSVARETDTESSNWSMTLLVSED